MNANREQSGAVEATPFIPYAEIQTAPPPLAAILERYMARMGFLPNALRMYLHRPEIAEALWVLNDRIMRHESSVLPQALKRRLGAVASRINGCRYCTSHHCEILKRPAGEAEGWDMPESELLALLSGTYRPADERERVCLEFVTAASLDPQGVPEVLYADLRRHLSPPEIIELAALVGFWKMYNAIHDSLRIPLEAALQANAGYVEVGA